MNTVPIFVDNDDAEIFAVILIRSEVTYEVEKYDDDIDHGYLFTVYEEEYDDSDDYA